MTPDHGLAETSCSHFNKTGAVGRSSRWTVLLAVAAGALAGFTAATVLDRPRAAVASRGPGAPETATEWMSMARRLSEPGSDQALLGALAQALASDTSLFRAIVEEFGRAEERLLRATLRELIVASARPDVLTAGTELTRKSDGLQRGAGFELLARLAPTPESYAMAMRATLEETDPTALAGALMALRPPGLPSNADVRQLLPRFILLAQHSDALVRGHAIQQLASWDKAGEQATPIVLAALSDRDRLVRQAAVGAVMIGGLRSEGLKQALLRVAADRDEDPTSRGSALYALERLPLTDAEQAEHRAAREDVDRFLTTYKEENLNTERQGDHE